MNSLTLTKKGRRIDDNMVPMINIVFLLLIFFMVAARIQQSAPSEIHLPHSTQTETNQQPASTLFVNADGKLTFRGQRVELAELPGLLASSSQAPPETISLHVDQRLTASQLDSVLAPLRQFPELSLTLVTRKAAE